MQFLPHYELQFIIKIYAVIYISMIPIVHWKFKLL